MKKSTILAVAVTLVLLTACTTDGTEPMPLGQRMENSLNEIAKGVETGVSANFSGEDIVRGRILIQSPIYGYFTCFKDIKNGYVSRYPIDNPSQAEGTPAAILTRDGYLGTGICDEWDSKGLLVRNPNYVGSHQDAQYEEIQRDSQRKFDAIQAQVAKDQAAAQAQARAAYGVAQ